MYWHMLNRLLLQVAQTFHLTVIVTMCPLHLHLFTRWDDAVNYAWSPVKVGCWILNEEKMPGVIEEFLTRDLERYEGDVCLKVLR